MMLPALLCGGILGLGLLTLVRALVRPQPGIAALVERIDNGRRSMRLQVAVLPDDTRRGRAHALISRLADAIEVQAAERGWRLGGLRTDLALMNRTAGEFLASKVVTALGLLLLSPALWSLALLAGIPLPTAVPVGAGLVLAGVGLVLPDLALKGEAANRRRDFRRIVGVFLDLVAMNLAGGRGLPEALLAASTVSDHWCLMRIRQALANARLRGTTPWAALGELGEEIGLEELRDLSGALGLAADDGAKIRASLSARAASLRRKEMADSEGSAGERSQSMLVAQLLICSAFLLFLIFPAVSQLLRT